MARKRRPRIPAVVPKVVFSTIFVGVVPACVVSACGSGNPTYLGEESSVPPGVAAVAYQCFDANDPHCYRQGVAAVAYQCFDAGKPAPCNGGVADAAFGDAPSDAIGDADADTKG